jgi:hypothetical protein
MMWVACMKREMKIMIVISGYQLYKLGTYQVETNPPVQTMQTPIRTIGSKSDGRGERWEQYAQNRPPGPLPPVFFCKPPST